MKSRHVPSFLGDIFYFIFPDDCRLCEQPLRNLSRIPVCRKCLALPQPLETEWRCRICRLPLCDEGDGLCTGCRDGEPEFQTAYCFGDYDGPLRELIHLLKYGRVETVAVPLGRMMARALPPELSFDIVIAMPMHWRKRLQRGFNQAELLARPIARRYGLKPSRCLQRTRYTKPQASLTEAERRKNLTKSFWVRNPQEVSGKRILLIDDVLTTGSTFREAARTLRAAGASSVRVLSLARVDRSGAQTAEALGSLQNAVGRKQHQADHLIGPSLETNEPISMLK